MSTQFVKMHGCGNDFVIIGGPLELGPARVRALCDRRTGIGADGIIVITPGEGLRRAVVVHNADGTIADACGNGYRCVARYVLDRAGGASCEMETPIGIVCATRVPRGIALDLAAPVLGEAVIVEHAGRALLARSVRVGNPNLVVFVESAVDLDLGALAQEARAAAGPGNVEAVVVRSQSELELRVEERGVGETLACGSGAMGAVAVGLAQGVIAGDEIRVYCRGGTLTVRPGREHYTLTGAAEYVFEGTLPGPGERH